MEWAVVEYDFYSVKISPLGHDVCNPITYESGKIESICKMLKTGPSG